MLQIYKPYLFDNPNITYKLNINSTNIDDGPIKQLVFYSNEFLINESALEKEILRSLRTFRNRNINNYLFTLTCPICLEESNDINFLFGLTDKNHICCYDCWKDYCLHTIKTSHDKINCIGCDKEIEFNLFNTLFKFDINLINNYSLRLYQSQYHNLIECSKCKLKFVAVHEDHNRCPECCFDVCKYCLELNHYELHMTCKKFEQFIKTREYINYFSFKEHERILRLCEKKHCQGIMNIKTELLLKVESRNQRIQEQIRQQELIKNEQRNLKWIMNNTKKCPKCGNAIEKNKGCNHMTCKCKYEFCWYCLEECTNPCDHFKKCKAGAKWFDDGYRE